MVTVAGGQLAVYQGANEAPKLTITRQMNVRSIYTPYVFKSGSPWADPLHTYGALLSN
jgi:hypothetical protein